MLRRRPLDGSSRRAVFAVGLLAALPWTWFLLRDAAGRAGDVLAIVGPPLVVLIAVAGVVAAHRQRRWLLPAASVLAVGIVAVLGPWLPADAGAVAAGSAVTVAGANVRAGPDAAGSILSVSPDVLVVGELTPHLDPPLAAGYPHRQLTRGGPEVGVYSRLPLRVLDRPASDLPGLRVEVDGPAGPFILYALHVPRPWFTTRGGYQATVGEHHRIMAALAARVAAETLPVVVVGDLNSPDRGRDYRQLLRRGGLVDAIRDRGTTFTSTGQWTPLLLRIDHVLVTTGWCGDAAGQFDLPGSDHRGVTAAVGPCAVRSP